MKMGKSVHILTPSVGFSDNIVSILLINHSKAEAKKISTTISIQVRYLELKRRKCLKFYGEHKSNPYKGSRFK